MEINLIRVIFESKFQQISLIWWYRFQNLRTVRDNDLKFGMVIVLGKLEDHRGCFLPGTVHKLRQSRKFKESSPKSDKWFKSARFLHKTVLQQFPETPHQKMRPTIPAPHPETTTRNTQFHLHMYRCQFDQCIAHSIYTIYRKQFPFKQKSKFDSNSRKRNLNTEIFEKKKVVQKFVGQTVFLLITQNSTERKKIRGTFRKFKLSRVFFPRNFNVFQNSSKIWTRTNFSVHFKSKDEENEGKKKKKIVKRNSHQQRK